MHIAMVASLLLPVPPLKYGGTERVLADLITGLSKRGHKITLFTCNGSSMPEIPNLEIVESSPFPIIRKEKEYRHYDIDQFITLLKRAGGAIVF